MIQHLHNTACILTGRPQYLTNKGVVTCDYKPYTELLDEMKRLNDNVYPLIDYFDSK